MSFGFRDEDWVDPPSSFTSCTECDNWNPCPHCGEKGWCIEYNEYTNEDDWCE